MARTGKQASPKKKASRKKAAVKKAPVKKKASPRKKAPAKKASRPPTGPAKVTLNKAQLAYLLGLSERQVGRLQKEGMPVEVVQEGRHGWQVDGRAVIAWFVRRQVMKEIPAAGDDGEAVSYSAERLRLTKEQANEKEIANEIARGQLIRADHVRDYAMESAALLAANLDGMGSRLANELAGIEDAATCRSIVRTETNRIRSAFAASLDKLADSFIDRPASETDH